MDATSLAAVWATVALFIFLGIAAYLKVPGTIGKALDARADRIRNELEEARKLREEAQQVLAEYQRKRKEAEAEATDDRREREDGDGGSRHGLREPDLALEVGDLEDDHRGRTKRQREHRQGEQ